MKLLSLTPLFITSAEAWLLRRGYTGDFERPFGQVCSFINVTNSNTLEEQRWTAEGFCGKWDAKEKHTIDLDQCVGNDNGSLVWRKGSVIPPKTPIPPTSSCSPSESPSRG